MRSINIFSLALLVSALFVGSALAELPGVNVKDLKKDEVGDLELLMKQGACPCDPKVSLFECIEKKSCPAATELASFGADKMREGLGTEQVMKAVIKKYMNDHVPAATFNLKGVAHKGDPKAKIVIVEFADFECPHCSLMRGILADVMKAYPKDVVVYFKQFPIGFHVYAETASRATLAAQKQGRFWPMHDIIFDNQTKLKPESFEAFAKELGLNLEKFKADLNSPDVIAQVQADKAEGTKAGLQGTPTLFFNGKMFLDEKTPELLKAHVAELLKVKK